MGNKRKFRLAVVLAAAIGGCAWLSLRPAEPEPVYEGRPLSYWLEGHEPEQRWSEGANNLPPRKADEAVRQAGTNALPILLRMLRARNSALTLKLVAFARKQHYVPIHFVSAFGRNMEAAYGFQTLGAGASNAVPALIKILEEKRSLESEIYTAISLGRIGPAAAAAVPALLRNAADPAAEVRGVCASALGEIGAEPGRVVPALIQCLKDPSSSVRNSAVQALGDFGAAAKVAIPALVAAAHDTQFKLHFPVIVALKQIDPAAAEVLENEK